MSAQPEFDEADIAALIELDDDMFKRLVKAYHPMLVSLANSIVGEAFGDEVVQEAWVAIYRNLPKFEHRSSLKTWLYRITSNQAISRLRKENRQYAFVDHDKNCAQFEHRFSEDGHWSKPPSQWSAIQPDEQLFSEELQDCINHTLHHLPQLQQAIFILNDIEGEKSETVCNILQITASNMRVLLHRARTQLFNHIDHFQETGEC